MRTRYNAAGRTVKGHFSYGLAVAAVVLSSSNPHDLRATTGSWKMLSPLPCITPSPPFPLPSRPVPTPSRRGASCTCPPAWPVSDAPPPPLSLAPCAMRRPTCAATFSRSSPTSHLFLAGQWVQNPAFLAIFVHPGCLARLSAGRPGRPRLVRLSDLALPPPAGGGRLAPPPSAAEPDAGGVGGGRHDPGGGSRRRRASVRKIVQAPPSAPVAFGSRRLRAHFLDTGYSSLSGTV
ncbi:hypothetical protein THAOC_29469 [Thalassiosira oceanica]|uniref:Uncharacterized protein n=1 Tax=Thalassiosira oceanica TaxID=159749 RepID=K0RDR7_THAOC|nr:hypothetical protein THAOC_29469 [Thalassiosira oceanica]|eukprot:EJK51360.1 hypothetical protein THAOC_29469 [Thalassiosira oceanica]